MHVRALTLLALLGCLSAAVAQPSGTRLRGESESGRTRKRLTEAQQKLDAGQPVADELQDILDQSGDDLVLVKDDQYQPARRLVQQYLASLPDKPLNTFRDRIEEPAKKLLDAGKKRRDPQPLRELVERYFVSRPAEEGLLLLGELMFERGDFVAAGRYWRALLPDDPSGGLSYPKPKTDPAGVKAKLILMRATGGDRDGATADLEQFRKEHPKAAGLLGGVNGAFADTLAKLIASPPALTPASGGWTAFGGGPARDGRPDTPLPRFLAGERPWRVAIPRDGKDKPRPPASATAARLFAYHPVIVGRTAYIADAGRVIQFDLTAGTARVAFHALTLDMDATDLTLPDGAEADFTLTAADGKLFARFGPTALPTGNDTGRKPRTLIACLEPKPDPAKLAPDEYPLTAKWHIAPPVGKDVYAAWEGAPVVADGRMYAAFVRADNNRLVTAIACYPLGGGEPTWVTDVCDSDPRAAARNRHELLTLAGSNVVYASHTGVTVAVSAATGKPAWAFRNPPAERPPVNPTRDLCPPVYADGRVFLAPADGDAVYALDADTGRKLWATTAPLHVEHLLGVSRDRLIATTHTARTTGNQVFDAGVRGFDVFTGRTTAPDGWTVQARSESGMNATLNSHGRGVAAENLVLWPTAGKVFLLDPTTGRQPRYTNARLVGNVAVAAGYVVAATNTEVCWYQFDGDAVIPPPKANYPLVGVKDAPAFDPKVKVTAAEKMGFDLPAPAEERKAVALPPFPRPLVPLVAVREAPLVLCDGKTLFAHDADSGKELWQTKLDPPAVCTRVACTTDGKLLALGDFAVMAVEQKTGKIAWQFRVPEADPTPKLSGLVFTGNRLLAKLGDRGLIALDLNTGRVSWTRSADGDAAVEAYALDSTPQFGPHMAAVGDRVYVQRGGECWALDAATGERRATFPTTVQAWSSPPLAVGEQVVLPAADGTLAAVSGGVSKRFFDPGRESSRTGTPPTVREFGGAVFAVVPRNYGDEVYRANSPRLLPAGVDLLAADADDERLYLPGAGKVFALGRESLKEAWRSTLPEMPDGTRWQVLAGRTTLIVYPTEAVPVTEWPADGPVRSVVSRPTPLRLIGTATEAIDAATRFTLPVLILDSGTGKIQQRLDVAVGGPTVAVLPRTDGLLVAGVGRAVWLTKK